MRDESAAGCSRESSVIQQVAKIENRGAAKMSSLDAVAGYKNVLFSHSKCLYNDTDDDDF